MDYAKLMVLLRFLVYYAVPLVIIGVFYILIARHLMYAANVPGEMHGAVRQVSEFIIENLVQCTVGQNQE